jgi:hypothetical protein
MRGGFDAVIYVVLAPIRLFGRSRRFRLAFGAGCVVAAFFAITLWALDRLLPPDSGGTTALANLPPLPPLQPVTRSSYVIAPVAIALDAIQRSLDAIAPRELVGRSDNPVSSILSKADIGITIARGDLMVNGLLNELTVTAPLYGTLRLTGQIATQAGNLTGSLTSLLDSSIGKNIGRLTSRVLDERTEVRGNVIIQSKPALTANWRLEPNLTAQVALVDSAVALAGFKINASSEAKSLIEREVNARIASMQTRLRNDPFIERAARTQWAKMCRSIPLGGEKTGLPRLWLEMRPMRAAAAQPQIDGRNVTITIGVQADTRITPKESTPDCPFPAKLELVPPMDNGRLAVGVPIDVPFGEINKLLEAQLKGRHFPEGGDTAVDIEVRRVSVAAASDRLLLSLRVKAREKKSWFGFGAEATVQIWGKPALDEKTQILRLTELSVAVRSEAAYGLLDAAVRSAMPHLQQALADHAVVDLTPFAADAKAKIGLALAEFQPAGSGVQVGAAVHDLRLTGIEFDSNTLRVIAQADGIAKVAVSELLRM